MELILPFYSNSGKPTTLKNGCSSSFIRLPFSLLVKDPVASYGASNLQRSKLRGIKPPFLLNVASSQSNTLSFPAMAPSYIPIPDLAAIIGRISMKTCGISRIQMSPRDMTATLINIFFGYTLFQPPCYNGEPKTYILLLLHFITAKRHNPVSFLATFHELEKHIPALSIENLCLDSALY